MSDHNEQTGRQSDPSVRPASVGWLRALSPYGVLLGWGLVLPVAVLALASAEFAGRSPEVCQGLGIGCKPGPLTSTLLFTFLVIGPVLAGSLLLITVLHLFKSPLKLRVWIACLGPPLLIAAIAIMGWPRSESS